SVKPGSSTGALSVGVGIGRNKLKNTIKSYIANSTVDASDDIDLQADSQADVSTLGVGVAGSVARGGGSTGAIAGAGSAAVNEVDNTIETYITGSGGTKHVITTGALSMAATDDTDVTGV